MKSVHPGLRLRSCQARRRSGRALSLACAVALTSITYTAAPGTSRFYVTSTASSLIDAGLAAAAPTGSELAAFEEVPDPGIRFRPSVARATNMPWIDSNAWRFKRGIQRAYYARLPAGSAALAAAEAFTYNVDAILNPDPADVAELGKMLRFLKGQGNEQPPLPSLVNIGVVDDKSSIMGEVLNMLTRRNLLYRVVASPDPTLNLNVQLGTPDFPAASAINPSDFAARVRGKLGDDKRLVRLYGTSTLIAHLTGDEKRARLYLLAFSGSRRQQVGGDQAVRVRLLGRYQPTRFAGYGSAQDARLTDFRHPENATEFWVPDFNIFAAIDLERVE